LDLKESLSDIIPLKHSQTVMHSSISLLYCKMARPHSFIVMITVIDVHKILLVRN